MMTQIEGKGEGGSAEGGIRIHSSCSVRQLDALPASEPSKQDKQHDRVSRCRVARKSHERSVHDPDNNEDGLLNGIRWLPSFSLILDFSKALTRDRARRCDPETKQSHTPSHASYVPCDDTPNQVDNGGVVTNLPG